MVDSHQRSPGWNSRGLSSTPIAFRMSFEVVLPSKSSPSTPVTSAYVRLMFASLHAQTVILLMVTKLQPEMQCQGGALHQTGRGRQVSLRPSAMACWPRVHASTQSWGSLIRRAEAPARLPTISQSRYSPCQAARIPFLTRPCSVRKVFACLLVWVEPHPRLPLCRRPATS